MAIISLSGRISSGKTELSNLCEKYGYKRIFWANPLKTLIANLLNIESIDKLNQLKTENKPFKAYSKDMAGFINQETGIRIDTINETMSQYLNKDLTIREWLQIVGTDLIRTYYIDWHVNKTMNTVKPLGNYVIDDTRFKNEFDYLKKVNAFQVFVIRPMTNALISNHESETTLDWRMFENVIINDGTINDLHRKFTDLCDIQRIKEYNKYNCSNTKIIKPTETNNGYCINYKGEYKEVTNPYEVEDLKRLIKNN